MDVKRQALKLDQPSPVQCCNKESRNNQVWGAGSLPLSELPLGRFVSGDRSVEWCGEENAALSRLWKWIVVHEQWHLNP